jgi:hypothetical protein
MNPALDQLSQAARDILKLNVTDAYTHLVVTGAGDREAFAALQALSPEDMLSQQPKDRDEAAGLLAGLWLWHDCLDESHRISQSITTPTGSMWHAIMHRREGDFSNSKYWYARCRNHSMLQTLGATANEVINTFPADKRAFKIAVNGWNPDALVDLVEAVCDKPSDPSHRLAVSLQQLEWRTLFDSCTRAAM